MTSRCTRCLSMSPANWSLAAVITAVITMLGREELLCLKFGLNWTMIRRREKNCMHYMLFPSLSCSLCPSMRCAWTAMDNRTKTRQLCWTGTYASSSAFRKNRPSFFAFLRPFTHMCGLLVSAMLSWCCCANVSHGVLQFLYVESCIWRCIQSSRLHCALDCSLNHCLLMVAIMDDFTSLMYKMWGLLNYMILFSNFMYVFVYFFYGPTQREITG